MPRKTCSDLAATIPSTAISMLPPVPFLKPIGMLSPLAISRCGWLSVVLAPIAPHEITSPRYCGVNGSRNSVAVGSPCPHTSSRNWRARAMPSCTSYVPFRFGSLISPLPPHRRPRLLEVHPHQPPGSGPPPPTPATTADGRSPVPTSVSWIEHGPTIISIRPSTPLRISSICRRCPATCSRIDIRQWGTAASTPTADRAA